MNNIRNFSIIAHIDHGKSTLSDRLLEYTNTIEKRKMKEQVLDSMELERERGITIKMQPVRMVYRPSQTLNPKHEILNKSPISNSKVREENLGFRNSDLEFANSEYILNLIDTPGHIDFSYEVSRALKAVEGSILLVDATQGVQAQTLTTLNMAREANLTIIPVLSKIDSPLARIVEVKQEIIELLGCHADEVIETSGKTGAGVPELLQAIIERIPPPRASLAGGSRSLVFDFQYSNHRGVIVYVRVFDGEITKNNQLMFKVANERFIAGEVGIFAPDETPIEKLSAGEIGYIVTGIKEPGIASVGDTVAATNGSLTALPGYLSPKPVVWASLYPESQPAGRSLGAGGDDFILLRQALSRLRLSDSSFSYEEEASGTLGRGFRVGFLGMLHLEIITERLRREFSLELIVTTPTITYEVWYKNGKQEMVYSPALFPEDTSQISKIMEPVIELTIIVPNEYLGALFPVIFNHEGEVGETVNFGDGRSSLSVKMPLRELMRHFFDTVKSVSSGYASMSYEIIGSKEAEVVRLDVIVADELVPAFSRVVSKRLVQEEAEKAVEKLHQVLPRQLFVTKIQAKALGRIISSRTLSALRKDVTGYLYGGDVTRKKKLLEKQKKGKKKMRARGKVNIPHEVFLNMMKG